MPNTMFSIVFQEIEKLVLNKISGIGEDDVDRDRVSIHKQLFNSF